MIFLIFGRLLQKLKLQKRTYGEFIDQVSMEEYIELCSQYKEQDGMTNEEMKIYCEKIFPTLKRWNKK